MLGSVFKIGSSVKNCLFFCLVPGGIIRVRIISTKFLTYKSRDHLLLILSEILTENWKMATHFQGSLLPLQAFEKENLYHYPASRIRVRKMQSQFIFTKRTQAFRLQALWNKFCLIPHLGFVFCPLCSNSLGRETWETKKNQHQVHTWEFIMNKLRFVALSLQVLVLLSCIFF